MKRATGLAYFGAIALLACGCAPREYFPDAVAPEAVDPVLAPAPEPTRTTVSAPARSDLLARWELPATSPWVPYQKLTLPSVLAASSAPVSLPNVEEIEEVRLAHLAAESVAAAGIPADAAWFIDLQGAASVAFASTLSHGSRATIAVVPTFNNWPAEGEIIPAEETLAAMIAMPPRLPSPSDVAARPMFLLDSWRLAYKDEEVDDDVVDNRYMLTPADFPAPEVLRQQGITQIVYVVATDDIEWEEDDLHELFESYAAAGIAIHLVDLAMLARFREPQEDPWFTEILYYHPYVVRPRHTVVHDPRFYHRAKGGFGGVHLVPLPGGHVHFGYGGHGGG